MAYRSHRSQRSPGYYSDDEDTGPSLLDKLNPSSPDFSRVQNDLLSEICDDIGIKDSMDLDFYDMTTDTVHMQEEVNTADLLADIMPTVDSTTGNRGDGLGNHDFGSHFASAFVPIKSEYSDREGMNGGRIQRPSVSFSAQALAQEQDGLESRSRSRAASPLQTPNIPSPSSFTSPLGSPSAQNELADLIERERNAKHKFSSATPVNQQGSRNASGAIIRPDPTQARNQGHDASKHVSFDSCISEHMSLPQHSMNARPGLSRMTSSSSNHMTSQSRSGSPVNDMMNSRQGQSRMTTSSNYMTSQSRSGSPVNDMDPRRADQRRPMSAGPVTNQSQVSMPPRPSSNSLHVAPTSRPSSISPTDMGYMSGSTGDLSRGQTPVNQGAPYRQYEEKTYRPGVRPRSENVTPEVSPGRKHVKSELEQTRDLINRRLKYIENQPSPVQVKSEPGTRSTCEFSNKPRVLDPNQQPNNTRNQQLGNYQQNQQHFHTQQQGFPDPRQQGYPNQQNPNIQSFPRGQQAPRQQARYPQRQGSVQDENAGYGNVSMMQNKENQMYDRIPPGMVNPPVPNRMIQNPQQRMNMQNVSMQRGMSGYNQNQMNRNNMNQMNGMNMYDQAAQMNRGMNMNNNNMNMNSSIMMNQQPMNMSQNQMNPMTRYDGQSMNQSMMGQSNPNMMHRQQGMMQYGDMNTSMTAGRNGMSMHGGNSTVPGARPIQNQMRGNQQFQGQGQPQGQGRYTGQDQFNRGRDMNESFRSDSPNMMENQRYDPRSMMMNNSMSQYPNQQYPNNPNIRQMDRSASNPAGFPQDLQQSGRRYGDQRPPSRGYPERPGSRGYPEQRKSGMDFPDGRPSSRGSDRPASRGYGDTPPNMSSEYPGQNWTQQHDVSHMSQNPNDVTNCQPIRDRRLNQMANQAPFSAQSTPIRPQYEEPPPNIDVTDIPNPMNEDFLQNQSNRNMSVQSFNLSTGNDSLSQRPPNTADMPARDPHNPAQVRDSFAMSTSARLGNTTTAALYDTGSSMSVQASRDAPANISDQSHLSSDNFPGDDIPPPQQSQSQVPTTTPARRKPFGDVTNTIDNQQPPQPTSEKDMFANAIVDPALAGIPFTPQQTFIQSLVCQKSTAYRSHPLFPLLRDLIIADLNFNNPNFPHRLIANLPKDFGRLLQNYAQRNKTSLNYEKDRAKEGVMMDALKYAHKSLIDKIAVKTKASGEDPAAKENAVEDFCERFDQSIRNSFQINDENRGYNSMPKKTMDSGMSQRGPKPRQDNQDKPQQQADAGPPNGRKHPILPKESVNVMLDWLRKHRHNPYPNDEEKELLQQRTKLSVHQINYWFTNARRRILPRWAMAEMGQVSSSGAGSGGGGGGGMMGSGSMMHGGMMQGPGGMHNGGMGPSGMHGGNHHMMGHVSSTSQY